MNFTWVIKKQIAKKEKTVVNEATQHYTKYVNIMGKYSFDLVFEMARHMLMMLLCNGSPPSNIYVSGTKRQRPKRAQDKSLHSSHA